LNVRTQLQIAVDAINEALERATEGVETGEGDALRLPGILRLREVHRLRIELQDAINEITSVYGLRPIER